MSERAQDRRVKVALDETRLLILGAQILLGFHLNGTFQTGFDELGIASRALHGVAFLLMALTMALLMTPTLQHRIVDAGRATARMIHAASRYAALALLPFAIALGADIGIVLGFRFGHAVGLTAGLTFTCLALSAWYGTEWLLEQRLRRTLPRMEEAEIAMPSHSDTPIETRVEHMLTEARVLLPGAQAMLGFQLAVLLTEAFARLPELSKSLHAAALLSTALAVILLTAPAAFHRITFHGASTETFHRLGSGLILAAAVPLALGVVLELYVAVTRAMTEPMWGVVAASSAAVIFIALWLIGPLLLRLDRTTRA